ncbi:hypothetical protein [Burkholderia anthina]|uniref:hypothetical protein n=1 Tax=Burkholderia anthina TaxID=179879 RepID=UPI001AA07168|nr:hypothetical protein [Burkholderia anthina]QTD94941.1 hypothetical protein J4G50_33470 [Burkholderia anthina]
MRRGSAKSPQISDFTYVSAWQSWLYAAVVIGVLARRIVGWRVGALITMDFALSASEQALSAQHSEGNDALSRHSDCPTQMSNRRSTAVATAVATRRLKRSTACHDGTASSSPRAAGNS